MAIVRWRPRREWDPFAGLFDLRREFSDLFAAPVRWEGDSGQWCPPVDIYSDDNKVVVQTELPGVKEEDIDVSLDGGVLTIKGERKHETEVKEEGYHRVERASGTFQRAFAVPAEVDPTNIKADLKDGVLTITLPKVEEAKARKIKVEAK
jgi:HSP20 family protein